MRSARDRPRDRRDALNLMRIENGAIAEHWCVWDTAGLMQQIGAMPATATA
jgi:hypothetical protein